ncbi:MAG: hypothetical protein U0704_04290 [Candidatus Eisenbacteria bacterium]
MAEGALRELAALAADPERWPSLDEDTLLLVVFQQALHWAHSQDPQAAEALALLYPYLVTRVDEAERLELQDRIVSAVEEGHVPVAALAPFLQHEPAPVAVALAAVSFATLMPLEDGDELTGPRTLMRMASHADDEGARVGLLAGLLQLGDARVLPLLAPVWDALEPESRVRLATLPSPSKLVFAATVEFWMRALEAGEGCAADALVRLAREAEPPRVLALERKFPANAPDDRDEITVLDDRSLAEQGALLAPRLAALPADHPAAARRDELRAAWEIGEAR